MAEAVLSDLLEGGLYKMSPLSYALCSTCAPLRNPQVWSRLGTGCETADGLALRAACRALRGETDGLIRASRVKLGTMPCALETMQKFPRDATMSR